VEFSLALPEEQRWSKEKPKIILRQAMRGMLPPLVENRKDKAEFSPQVDRELKERQAYKVESLIHKSILGTLGLIDMIDFTCYIRNIESDSSYSIGISRFLSGELGSVNAWAIRKWRGKKCLNNVKAKI
jgi:hypothetical protein